MSRNEKVYHVIFRSEECGDMYAGEYVAHSPKKAAAMAARDYELGSRGNPERWKSVAYDAERFGVKMIDPELVSIVEYGPEVAGLTEEDPLAIRAKEWLRELPENAEIIEYLEEPFDPFGRQWAFFRIPQ